MTAARKMSVLGCALLVGAAVLGSNNAFAQGDADYVLTNDKIYTVNDKQPWAEAVAIKGSDIVYVGDDNGAREFIGANTTVADLRGKMMLPGFIDTHSQTMLGRVVHSDAVGWEDPGGELTEVFEDFDYCSSNDEQAHVHGK